MTLLVTVFAAVFTTLLWYRLDDKSLMLSIPLFMFWGASIMWFVDAVFEYVKLRDAYFTPAPEDMLNDAFLGFSGIALVLVIWIVAVLIKDPKGVIRRRLRA